MTLHHHILRSVEKRMQIWEEWLRYKEERDDELDAIRKQIWDQMRANFDLQMKLMTMYREKRDHSQ